jgi:hypothetical protein
MNLATAAVISIDEPDPCSIAVTADDATLTVQVSGELDHEWWPWLKRALRSCGDADVDAVVVDLRQVSFVSGSVACELYLAVRALDGPTVTVLAPCVLIRLVGLLTTVELLPADARSVLAGEATTDGASAIAS